MVALMISNQGCAQAAPHPFKRFLISCAVLRNNILRLALVLTGVALFTLFAETITPVGVENNTPLTQLQH